MFSHFLLKTFYELNKFSFNSFFQEKKSDIENIFIILQKIIGYLIFLEVLEKAIIFDLKA